MRKRYIPYAAVLLAAAANAQTPVFHEGFDAEQTKEPTALAWYEFINQITNTNGTDSWVIDNQEQAEGAGCLKMNNVEPEYSEGEDMAQYDQFWKRGVKFRNLPLQEGKSYRLTWRLKGANTWFNGTEDKKSRMNVSLMQGGENADIPLLDAQGNEFKYEVSYFNQDSYEKYVRMFHFASAQLQKDTYAKQHPDKDPLADTFFATFNVFNPGEYYLDEVNLVESPVAGVAYEYYAIRVDLGFPTNIKDLVKNSPLGVVLMPEGCAKVTVNGEEVEVESVELHENGYMYIYTVDEIEEGADVKIAFNNPEDEACQVKYQGTLAPEGAVPSFEDEAADFQETISDENSYIYFEPSVSSVSPEEGSFGLEDVTEVAFTFDRKIDVKSSFQCLLNGDEALVLKTTENSETMVFMRKDGKPFDKGLQEITLSGVVSEVGTEAYDTFTSTFEVGRVQLAETEYTSVGSCLFPEAAEGSIPEGWTVYSDGEERAGGTTWGGGGRVFSTVAPQGRGIYTRANGGDGTVQSPVMAIPAGDIEIRSYLAYWSNPSDIRVDVCDEAGNVVATKTVTPSVKGENVCNVSGFMFESCPITFNTQGGNFYVKYTLLTSGFNGMFVGGYDTYTYKQSAGESSEAKVVFNDKSFGEVQNNGAPLAGSGWRLYDNEDTSSEKGYFNNGESWPFGHSRFWTGNSFKNLASLFYTRGGGWPNHYVTYGEIIESEPDEPTLYLEAGRHQFTYYALNWKGSPLEYHFQIIDEETKEVLKEVVTSVEECANGARDYSGDSHKIQFVYSVPKDGNYSIKYGGTGESFSGPVTIEKLGSQAAYQLGIVNEARKLAEEELANAANESYNGATKTNLEEVIAKYKDPSVLHTPAEVEAARVELEAATKAMQTRRDYIDRYESALTAVENGVLAATETKYEKLEQFPIAQEAFNKYVAIEPQTLNDAELISAVDVMSNTGALLENMVNTCVPLLTQQIADLSAAILNLDATMSGDETEVVLAADDAISDDQELVKTLKKIYAAKLYAKIAAGAPIVDVPEDPDEEVPANRPVSFLIQNNKFYSKTIIPANKPNAPSSVEDFPGWNIEVTKGQIQPLWDKGWGQQGPSDVRPIYDCAVCAPWGDGAYTVEQVVSDLPVAKYLVSLVVAADAINADNNEFPQCSAYVTVGGEKTETPWEGTVDGDGKTTYSRDNNVPIQFEGVVPAAEGNLSSFTMGANMSVACFGKVDNANLAIIDKVEGFDYAAAAKALQEEIETSIEAAGAPEGEPVSVTFFSANGVQVAAPTPNEVTIRVERYANGFVKVVKFRAQK